MNVLTRHAQSDGDFVIDNRLENHPSTQIEQDAQCDME